MALPVVIKARGQHTATMIFLHGLGDTGHGWAAGLNTIAPSFLKIVCPTAPSIPVTLNQGFVMPAWYDIRNLDPRGEDREDLDGVDKSTKLLEAIIDMEARTVEGGRSKVMIGGFSQGGAIAMNAVLRAKEPLAGLVALSTYIPGDKAPDNMEKQSVATPILHCHGEMDGMIPFERGVLTSKILKEFAAKDYSFHGFPNMDHECIPEELDLVKEFINKNLST